MRPLFIQNCLRCNRFYFILLSMTGVQSGGCGVAGIRMRPALIFQPQHAHMFIDRLRQVLAETK